jgi:hypothetical protein
MSALIISKKRVLGILDEFPENVIVEDFIDRIIIIAKIETAREQFKRGEYLTSEQLDEEIKKWD